MRPMAFPASLEARPASLMQRLAAVSQEQGGPHLPPAGALRRRPARGSTLVCFGLGALTSGAIGGAALLGLQGLAAGNAGIHIGMGGDRAAAPPAAAAPAKPAPYVFAVAIARSERGYAPFGMQLKGAADADIDVVLTGIPTTARLNRGERRGAGTWVVGRRDLDDLRIVLGDATPEAFDVLIEVLSPPPGVAAVGSLLRVRLVDAPAPAKAAVAARAKGADAREADPPLPPAIKLASAVVDTSDHAQGRKTTRAPAAKPPPAPDPEPASAKSAPPPRHWPEGASGLGAVPRGSERQVWWSMPPPSWSPFQPTGTH